jgi:carboxymethylenebutenolidase
MGQTITLGAAGARTFDSYLATPATGTGPGVVLVSTIFGIEPDVAEIADRLAADGCIASIPNMFWRDEQDSGVLVSPTDYARAVARSERINLDQSLADLGTVIADLKRRPECNGRIALMGFCFGGPYALLAAGGLVDVALSFHGSHVGKYLWAVDRVKCPLSFHYGDRDHVAPMSEIEEIKKALAHLPNAEVHVYPGAGHGYILRHRKDYIPEFAEKSWRRALELLQPLRTKGAQAAE